MARVIRDNTTLILIDGGSGSKRKIRKWLTNSGFITWEANDICHAIEELSDFTVRRRPDVVLLEVSTLPDSIEMFRSDLQLSSDRDEMSVLAFSSKKATKRQRYVAGDLHQLSLIMHAPSAAAAHAS